MRTFIGGLLVVGLLASPAFAADAYAVDPTHTTVGFSVTHLVISNMHGTFTDVVGTILYDPQDIAKSSVEITMKAASIDTHVVDRDTHLRSPDFLDVATHPTITFTSRRVERQGESYVCHGTLTIRGVSKEVAIPFRLLGPITDPWGKTRLGAQGELAINRQDYGVSWNKTLDTGGLVVGNEVRISLNVEAVRQE